MRIGERSRDDVMGRLDAADLKLCMGPFVVRPAIRISECREVFSKLYADFHIASAAEQTDFPVCLEGTHALRHPLRRQVVIACDGVPLFESVSREEAWPYFEWGLNACVARWNPYHLMIHAATVARDRRAVMFVGASGAGKSSLACALLQRGFRLLSDEFALVRLHGGQLAPLVRPICLKNEMIAGARRLFPDAVFGPPRRAARKGIVAHMAPPRASVDAMHHPALPTVIVFCAFMQDEAVRIHRLGRAEAMRRLVPMCFNYVRLGYQGFETLVELVDRCDCFSMVFGNAFAAGEHAAGLVA